MQLNTQATAFAVALALGLMAPAVAGARGGGGSRSSSHASSGSARSGSRSYPHSSGSRSSMHAGTHLSGHKSSKAQAKAVGVQRDSHGKIKRSEAAKSAFKKQHPCPSTGKSGGACPGYVIDHVRPLKRGGADDPLNMQWQTTAAAKAKDRWE